MSDLLEDDLPDDVAQTGGVERVGDAAQVEVDVRRGQEVDLDAANQRDVSDQGLKVDWMKCWPCWSSSLLMNKGCGFKSLKSFC